jgi:hypothetical protein
LVCVNLKGGSAVAAIVDLGENVAFFAARDKSPVFGVGFVCGELLCGSQAAPRLANVPLEGFI